MLLTKLNVQILVDNLNKQRSEIQGESLCISWSVKKVISLPSWPRHLRIFLPSSEWRFWRREFFFKPITWYIEMHHIRITCCSFTTCLSPRGKLTGRFASKKNLRICPEYILFQMINSGHADSSMAGKTHSKLSSWRWHVVNEHITRNTKKSWHHTCRKMASRDTFQCTSWFGFKTNWRHQKRYSEGGKKIHACRGLLGRVIVHRITDRAVWVRTLVNITVLCSWVRHFSLPVPLHDLSPRPCQVHQWVLANAYQCGSKSLGGWGNNMDTWQGKSVVSQDGGRHVVIELVKI